MGNSNTSANQATNEKENKESTEDDRRSTFYKSVTQSPSLPKPSSVIPNRYKTKSPYVPKPAYARPNPREVDFVHRHTDLHPIFKYSHQPVRGRHDFLRVKTNQTVPETTEQKNSSCPADHHDKIPLTEEEIYNRARNADPKLNKSYEDLVNYLVEGTQFTKRPEVTKARTLLIWLSEQNITSPLRGKGNYDTPDKGLIRLSNHLQTDYSLFYSILCERAGIESAEIEGVYKSISYEPGKEEGITKTSWNALHLEDKWYLVFPYFVCTKRKHTWLPLNNTGADKEKSNAKKPVFNEIFFMTDPKISMHFFHPDEPKWQLLQRAITFKEFLALPCFKSEFFELGLTMHSEISYILHSKNGQVQIVISCPKDISDNIYLWYDIFLATKPLKRNAEITKMTERSNLQKLVAMIKQNEKWTFQVSLPLEGTYKMNIYGGFDGKDFGTILKFQLQCDKKLDKISLLPSDSKHVGFGPGKAAVESGLLFPSHTNGLYPITTNGTFRISFMLDIDVVGKIKATGNLAQTEETGVKDYAKHVKCTVDADRAEVVFDTTVPGEGVYMLTIWSKLEEDSKKQTDLLKLACCYLLISKPDISRKVETKMQSEARENLISARKANTIDGIESAVVRCIHEQIPLEDEEVQAANTRAEILTLKRDIEFTFQHQSIAKVNNVLHRIEQNSKFAYYFRYDVEELHELDRALKWMKHNA